MTIHLPSDLENFVRAEVLSGHFADEDAMIAEILREYFRHQRLSQAEPDTVASLSADSSSPPKRKPLWERAAELRKTVPEEEWDKLPTDGAEQLDHYIYGSPKRTTS